MFPGVSLPSLYASGSEAEGALCSERRSPFHVGPRVGFLWLLCASCRQCPCKCCANHDGTLLQQGPSVASWWLLRRLVPELSQICHKYSSRNQGRKACIAASDGRLATAARRSSPCRQCREI